MLSVLDEAIGSCENLDRVKGAPHGHFRIQEKLIPYLVLSCRSVDLQEPPLVALLPCPNFRNATVFTV
jgi:hypothetical protein